MVTARTFLPDRRHDTYPAIDPALADLSGKVILVTGASRGIGRAIALAFAQAGASGLVLMARSDMSDIETACMEAQRGGQELRVLTLTVDTTNASDVANAVQQVREVFGRLDVVINNAGSSESLRIIGNTDPDEWWQAWTVNMLGTYHVTRAFLPLLLECGGARTVINITSVSAVTVTTHNSAYASSKLAINKFTETLTAEYAGDGLLSHAVQPGRIATDMTAIIPEPYRHILVDTPEVAAHTLVWLVRERREWLSGRYISCQWDVNDLVEKREEIVDGDKLRMRLVV